MLLSMAGFHKPDGSVDWKAYDKARVDNGELCYRCGQYVNWHNGSGKLQACVQCYFIHATEEFTHARLLRCPVCRHDWQADGDDNVWTDGEHRISCPSCDHTFEVATRISYSFTSPGLASSKEESDDERDESGN